MDQDEPHKLISTAADGKQRANHSYATRSKVKRTLHCDDGISGLEAQEPSLKRQTRPDAKQAGFVAINNDDATPDSNAVDTNTVEGNTPAQTALQNDLVLESLFRYMNRSDLLSCRVVNPQWQYEATKELRRRKLVIRFSFYCHGYQKRRNMLFRGICRRLSECRTPSLLSSFQVKTVARNELGSAGFGNIFTAVGIQMKNLTLHLNYARKRSSFERSSLMTHLHNLLFRQAPNLEFLEIKFDFPSHWENELNALELKSSAADHDTNDDQEFGLLPNLKTFIVRGSSIPKFFADVINAAVNLRSFGGAWSTCIKYLMGAEGRANKIHQLKSLQLAAYSTFRWNKLNKRGIKQMETFLTEHRQSLKLETFECVSEFIHGNGSSALRIVSVINQILECSAGSLQKLIIEPAKWFKDLLIIPRLPKLTEIWLDCLWSSCLELGDGGFFPRGFNMNNSFPNVSSIVLCRCSSALFRRFVSRMEVEEATEPVTSVRYITLIDKGKLGNIVPSLGAVAEFRHVFPNLVSVSYVDSDKYYKI